MTIKELEYFLENQIEVLNENCKIWEAHKIESLWVADNAKKTAYEEVLKKIKGS